MLTLQDCLALCELNEDEIKAIAEHEHIPQIVAAELGYYLVHTLEGVPMIRRMILEDILHAAKSGNDSRRRKLWAVLKHFIETHPERAGAVVGCAA